LDVHTVILLNESTLFPIHELDKGARLSLKTSNSLTEGYLATPVPAVTL